MRSTSLALIGAVAMLAACSDGTAPPDGATRVSLSFSTGSSVEAAPAAALAAAPISDGQNELVLSSVEVVLREIELKRVDVTDCDMEPEPDGCEKFETGPMLAQLPLDGSVAHVMSIDIEPGSYDEVEFDIHKVSSGDPEDAAFRSQYPSHRRRDHDCQRHATSRLDDVVPGCRWQPGRSLDREQGRGERELSEGQHP